MNVAPELQGFVCKQMASIPTPFYPLPRSFQGRAGFYPRAVILLYCYRRRRSFTEEVKTEKTKSILITAARVEMESEVEAHRLKSNM